MVSLLELIVPIAQLCTWGKEGGVRVGSERLVDIISHISHIHYADVAHTYAYLLHRIQSHSSVSTRNQYL